MDQSGRASCYCGTHRVDNWIRLSMSFLSHPREDIQVYENKLTRTEHPDQHEFELFIKLWGVSSSLTMKFWYTNKNVSKLCSFEKFQHTLIHLAWKGGMHICVHLCGVYSSIQICVEPSVKYYAPPYFLFVNFALSQLHRCLLCLMSTLVLETWSLELGAHPFA